MENQPFSSVLCPIETSPVPGSRKARRKPLKKRLLNVTVQLNCQLQKPRQILEDSKFHMKNTYKNRLQLDISQNSLRPTTPRPTNGSFMILRKFFTISRLPAVWLGIAAVRDPHRVPTGFPPPQISSSPSARFACDRPPPVPAAHCPCPQGGPPYTNS